MSQSEQIFELQNEIGLLKEQMQKMHNYIDAIKVASDDQEEKLVIIEELLEIDE